jgi:hypothetical protein
VGQEFRTLWKATVFKFNEDTIRFFCCAQFWYARLSTALLHSTVNKASEQRGRTSLTQEQTWRYSYPRIDGLGSGWAKNFRPFSKATVFDRIVGYECSMTYTKEEAMKIFLPYQLCYRIRLVWHTVAVFFSLGFERHLLIFVAVLPDFGRRICDITKMMTAKPISAKTCPKTIMGHSTLL